MSSAAPPSFHGDDSIGRWIGRHFLKPLASLKLTVVLLALAIFLVFAGTLAQVDEGIWTVVNKYFRQAFVLIPVQIFFPRSMHVAGSLPFPGGWLIGGILLVNLLAAHAVRFKASWARAGILLTHAGLVVMLLSEVVTGVFAVEGNMTIDVGGASHYLEHTHQIELAIVDPSDASIDAVTVIPGAMLRRGGSIQDDRLPFDVRVERYFVNSDLFKAAPAERNRATAGKGLELVAEERAEVSGTDPKQSVDAPSAYVTLVDKKTRRAMGTYLVSVWPDVTPQAVSCDDKTYDISLRLKRSYKPYSLRLLEFKHEKYMGTEIPMNFASRVRVVDPARGIDREVLIYMNHPLRYGGETFYQASFKPGDDGTVLQVVRNPGWLLPYVSCAMVALGLLAQFGLSLLRFLRRRATP